MAPAIASLSSPAPSLVSLVSTCLRLPVQEIDPRAPLTRYGLDSLAAIELVAALEHSLGRRLPDSLLLDCPDLESLERFIAAPEAASHDAPGRASELQEMLADSVLPADIRPERAGCATGAARAVLLTGATGFLGATLLADLLRETEADVYCLVRARGEQDAEARLRAALQARGLQDAGRHGRLRVVVGDLSRAGLGLSPQAWTALGETVDSIYHAAAVVDWTASYRSLREVNVLATRELLRLACRHHAKPFHFVSSVASVLVPFGPRTVDETDDMLARIDRLPLGYARSKCVAEALVRQASQRGLAATVFRPSLVSGDTRSGASNPTDILSSMIRGCVRMRAAPDLAWSLDCCPVDHVSSAIVRLSRLPAGSFRIFHLVGREPRTWRECVLSLNLMGHPVALLPYGEWLRRLDADAGTPDHPLRPLRAFFLQERPEHGDLTLAELYEDHRRPQIRADATAALLPALGIRAPRLDAALLDRYLGWLREHGALPAVARRARESRNAPAFDGPFFQSLLSRRADGRGIQVREALPLGAGSAHSIIGELSAWRSGGATGLFHYRLVPPAPGEGIEVVVKVKPKDEEVLAIGETVARLCGPALGVAYARHRQRLGLTLSHVREPAIYRQHDPRFRRHAPALLGAAWQPSSETVVLVLERLREVALLDTVDDVSGWTAAHVEAALGGIAEVQAIWYAREPALRRQRWLGPTRSAPVVADMRDLWTALADHAAGEFAAWAGPECRRIQRRLIAGCAEWWRAFDVLPRTLIHNDFNPRNIAFRRTAHGLRLVAYDWELATLGLPQHDLAELLCFVVSEGVGRDEVEHYVEVHRRALARATGCAIDAEPWRLGFRASLYDLLLDRLPMYAMVNTFRRQAFLPRVLRTWRALYELFPYDAPGGGPR